MNTFLELMLTSNITIPTYEILGLLILVTICLIIRSNSIGLLVSYLFAFRLTWIFFAEKWGYNELWFCVFIALGIILFIFTIIRMWQEAPESDI